TAALEQAARQAGDDADSHADLTRIQAKVLTYVADVQAATTELVQGSADATATLAESGRVLRESILPDVDALAKRSSAALDPDQHDARAHGGVLVVIVLVALGLALVVQIEVTRSSRRLLNRGLVIATVLVLVALVWTLDALGRQGQDLSS